jgi:hypothetical protein
LPTKQFGLTFLVTEEEGEAPTSSAAARRRTTPALWERDGDGVHTIVGDAAKVDASQPVDGTECRALDKRTLASWIDSLGVAALQTGLRA